MNHTNHRPWTVRALAALLPLFFSATLTFAAAEVRKNFDVPAGDAAAALKQFSASAGVQLLYSTDEVAGRKTAAVKGELTPRAALDQMLKDTGLVVVQDEKTGALAVKKDPLPNAERVAQTAATRTSQSKIEDGKLVLETFEVTAQRPGLVNQGVIPREENQAIYFQVLGRAEMEKFGVTNIQDALNLLSQNGDYGTSLQSFIDNTRATTVGVQQSTVSLRGFRSGETVVLLNGRRLPSLRYPSGADISVVPFGAIERIEVLPASASALYGGSAVGGVINIITRKNYHGRDVTFYYGTSTQGGGSEYRGTWTEGFSFAGGRSRLTTTLDYDRSDALKLGDRNYLAKALARFPINTPVRVGNASAFEFYILPALNSNPGTIVVNSPTLDLAIPGAPGARFAAIPRGQDGSALTTPDAFAATAGRANLDGQRYGRGLLITPSTSTTFSASFEHDFIPDKLTLYSTIDLQRQRFSAGIPAHGQWRGPQRLGSAESIPRERHPGVSRPRHHGVLRPDRPARPFA